MAQCAHSVFLFPQLPSPKERKRKRVTVYSSESLVRSVRFLRYCVVCSASLIRAVVRTNSHHLLGFVESMRLRSHSCSLRLCCQCTLIPTLVATMLTLLCRRHGAWRWWKWPPCCCCTLPPCRRRYWCATLPTLTLLLFKLKGEAEVEAC